MPNEQEINKAIEVLVAASKQTGQTFKAGQVEIVVKHISDNYQDSLEIGTPGKGGVVKVYCDFNKPEEAKAKLINAVNVRQFAADLVEGRTKPE